MEKPNRRFSFSKNERITSRNTIISLFSSGKAVKAFPLYAKYIFVPEQEVSCQILISVSKKKVKLAVNRNRIKRLVRESYRLNKFLLTDFLEQNELKIALNINYSLSDVISFSEIEDSVKRILTKICSDIVN